MIERQHVQKWSRGETTIQTIYLYPGFPDGWRPTTPSWPPSRGFGW
jgi:hypothetical protein